MERKVVIRTKGGLAEHPTRCSATLEDRLRDFAAVLADPRVGIAVVERDR